MKEKGEKNEKRIGTRMRMIIKNTNNNEYYIRIEKIID